MIGIFTFLEMAINSTCSGAVIFYENERKVIDYVKVENKSRQFIVHCTDGDVFPCFQEDLFEFEVTKRKVLKKSNRGYLKGKDNWGTEEIEK